MVIDFKKEKYIKCECGSTDFFTQPLAIRLRNKNEFINCIKCNQIYEIIRKGEYKIKLEKKGVKK